MRGKRSTHVELRHMAEITGYGHDRCIDRSECDAGWRNFFVRNWDERSRLGRNRMVRESTGRLNLISKPCRHEFPGGQPSHVRGAVALRRCEIHERRFERISRKQQWREPH